jgi:hypothetical protein
VCGSANRTPAASELLFKLANIVQAGWIIPVAMIVAETVPAGLVMVAFGFPGRRTEIYKIEWIIHDRPP